MQILHLADLHLGKRIYGYSLLEDQKYFLNETINYMKKNKIGYLIVAGDIFDSSLPSGEAMKVFDEYLTALVQNQIEAFIIPGNHDSNLRLSYLKDFTSYFKIHIVTNVLDVLKPFLVANVCFYLLPYTTTLELNNAFSFNAKNANEAFSLLVKKLNLNQGLVNILIMHQTVLPTNAEIIHSASEEAVVATISSLSSTLFKDFSYVALGHIHKSQNVSKNARYAGAPLVYHVDEIGTKKTITILEINNNTVTIKEDEIKPLREAIKLTGTFDEIINNHPEALNNYLYAMIKGPRIDNAMAVLKEKYPYALTLAYQTNKENNHFIEEKIASIENFSNEELFKKLFEAKTSHPLTERQKELIKGLLGGDTDASK